MINIVDLSSRRGAAVHLFPKVYALLKKEGHDLPHIHFWVKDMNKALVNIKCKWIFAIQGKDDVKGMLFYRVGDDAESLYIETLYGIHNTVVDALLKKFEQDDIVKSRKAFYLSRNVKREVAEEVLGTVGLQDDTVFDGDGYQLVGDAKECGAALRVRYLR